ncbi:DNA polymerase ligase N-terminal domain-containing protein [soil metagenome]
MSLDPYRAKRDQRKTPEPVPADGGPKVDHTGNDQGDRGDTFVVQEHHATALHWDLRLERDGVLVSWAVPKGLPLDPKTNHLAKQTEDHPRDYAGFAGEIPKGEYGGGRVTIWDSGTYELAKWSASEVMFVLHGGRVQGRYVLFRTGDRDWMLHRMDPPPPGWTALPRGLRPMLATAGALPREEDDWSIEVAWGGVRVLVAVYGGRLTITDGDEGTVTGSYPELRGLGLALGSRQVLLDGEIVALGAGGRPDPAMLRARARVGRPGAALLRDSPVQLMVLDLLHLDGASLLETGYHDRRAALESLELAGDHWQVPPAFPGGGAAVLDAAREQGLPGVVAKRRDSTYRPGRRTRDWRSITPRR